MTARRPDPDRSRAVLIGTARYTHPGLDPLPAVRANLEDLRAVLTAPLGAALPGPHCVTVADPATAREVGDHLTAAARAAEDLLLVYYAGHGLAWGNRNELYLTVSDTSPDNIGWSGFACAGVRQTLLDSTARARVLILDCCLSGRAIEQTMADPARTLLEQVDVEGAFILTATGPNQLALAPRGERNTVFTGQLLRLLRDGIAGAGPLLTLDVLYRQLKVLLRQRNRPEPTCSSNDAAAHLALAVNVVHPDAGGDLARLEAAVDDLANAEAATARAYRTALDKIAEPGLPAHRPVAPELARRLANLHRCTESGTQLAAELAELAREVASARAATDHRTVLAAGLLDRRAELRGRVSVLRATAVRLGVAERDIVSAAYARVRELLWTKPCDLGAATLAALAFQRSVTDEREGRTP